MASILEKKIGTVVEFEEDGHIYRVEGQRTRQYHFQATLLFYGFIDGQWAKRCATSTDPQECLESLIKEYNLKYQG